MKEKRLILICGFVIILFVYILAPYLEDAMPGEGSPWLDMEEDEDMDKDYLDKDIIRFHVRANSDRVEDQKLKLLIRDEILDLMDKRLTNIESVAQSRDIIKASMEDIQALSEGVVLENGGDYPIDVRLARESFPIKKYGRYVFPQGEYESLIVEIGEGKGQNWWCVMFPPLCFVDITHSVAIENNNNLDGFLVDETQPFRVKSIVWEWIRTIVKR